ncbi:MAG: glycosyltransferase [Candidatus Scalindua rubra]|uniref:Glycosyltransferase n=1 Tax=Candidatus Scalindua rubra TaxID=1872076 RepID=A0A1E3XGQ8_9BACT|nr:MAG: glycosyltransferase [Candidatus Scalindua rubra]
MGILMSAKQPIFSIIIPTHNRPKQLESCLNSIINLDYPNDRFEVVVLLGLSWMA